jgi:hypothetical protein
MGTKIKMRAIVALGLVISLSIGAGGRGNAIPNRFQEIVMLNRARHIARMAGERVNGGVERYRTEPAMHQGIGEQHVQDKGPYWLIGFLGGTPEEVSVKGQYSIYTVIRIDKTTFKNEVIYNGEIPEEIKRKRGLL